MTYILYKENNTICMTSEHNYYSFVRDANKIFKFEGFETFESAIAYTLKYSKNDNLKFKIIGD